MQSQQKKVKWSRGETADALEERTDTGITQVSVSKMENIIADIYGNISRRPALKIVDSVDGATDIPVIIGGSPLNSDFTRPPQSFVFTIDANTYIIFIAGTVNGFGGLLIHNNKFVRRIKLTSPSGLTVSYLWSNKISVAQYNNFMVVSNLYQGDVIFRLNGSTLDAYEIIVEPFEFSAPWVAPNGTQSIQVSSTEIPGLSFDSSSIGNYTYTEENGQTTVYSWIKTGLTSTISGTWTGPTTTYYYHITDTTAWFDTNATGGVTNTPITLTNGQTYTSGQTLVTAGIISITIQIGERAYLSSNLGSTLDVTENMNITSPAIAGIIPAGSIVQFPNNAAYMRVEGYDTDGSNNLRMYGSLLTPVANDHTTDTVVKVETGYISLATYQPKTFTFSNQRLYASAFYNADSSPMQIPGYAVGSQIGRYTDFKNDYNLQNEAVSIDISTSYQEQIVAMIDYNGLKILTDAAEYAYIDGGVVKQSENGSLAQCKPLVFGSICLYADKSGGQIRAMQYELQNNLFDSSTINQMTKEDLVFNTVSMAGMYDKEHFTGHFLYAVQTGYMQNASYDFTNPLHNHSLAVCNFVPGNQATIWTRWNTPELKLASGYDRHTVANVIEVNNKVWFIVNCYHMFTSLPTYKERAYTLAELDYDGLMDYENTALSTDTSYLIIKPTVDKDYYAWTSTYLSGKTVYTENRNPSVNDTVYQRVLGSFTILGTVTSITDENEFDFSVNELSYTATYAEGQAILQQQATIPGTVSIFDGDQYMWDDTLDENGNYTKSLSTLQNARVGFMINATLESHPIDIQGKTYTEKKRIGKAVAVIRNTDDKAFTVCDKTGYTSNDKKTVNFYGCTGMKDKVQYTIKNIKGAKFTIESLTMIIEYGTLDS